MGVAQRKQSRTAQKAGIKALAKILIVDDEISISETLAGVLQDEGYETAVATNGQEALALATESFPDVVLLDIWMPGWDGIETLQRLKSIVPRAEIIMISGHATIANALEASRAGAADFIEKPLDLESVLFAVRRALEKSAVAPAIQPAQVGDVQLFQHRGAYSTGLKGRNLGQRTLKRGAILYGQGLHSGMKSGLILEPLPPNSGIHFANIGDSKGVPAFVDQVESTGFATTIRLGNQSAATIEHLMSALHAYRISNLLVKCNGEVPIFDGSSIEFCNTIESTGIEEQGGEWYELAVDREIVIQGERKHADREPESITLTPADQLTITYELRYPEPVGYQRSEYRHTGIESYKAQIAPCRTFGFLRDIERLQKAGLAAGGRLDNFVLIGEDKVVNTTLRFPDELARHKILDILGDLFLIGRPLRAHIHAIMTGHSDNVAVLKKLSALATGE